MTTKDLQKIDELVHSADMAVRVASQLRLWLKRGSLSDQEAVDEGVRFLEEAVQGGKFVATGEMVAASSSLYPLTWAADVRFGSVGDVVSNEPVSVEYSELLEFLEGIKNTLVVLRDNNKVEQDAIVTAASFFDQLGQFLGSKADNALRSPARGTQQLHDRFSYQ